MHFILGKLFGRRYKLWYYKNHKHQWIWGLIEYFELMDLGLIAEPEVKNYDTDIDKAFNEFIIGIPTKNEILSQLIKPV